METGYKKARQKIIQALSDQNYQFAERNNIDEKNLLATGDVSPEDVIKLIKKSSGKHHTKSPHHRIPSVSTHIIKIDGWYIKFYFIDPDAFFISVHPY